MLSKYFETYLKRYKNDKTKKSVENSLKFVSNLEKININKINSIVENLNLNKRSKNLVVAHITTFIKYIAERERKHYEYKLINKFKNPISTKTALTDAEYEKFLDIIKNVMKNEQFLVIFELLRWNGLRLSEFVKIPWNDLYKTNWCCAVEASKRGNFRQVIVPDNIRPKLSLIQINYSKNTIQNLFTKLRFLIKQIWPEFKKPIHSHILRYTFITNAFFNGLNRDEIALTTGHASPNILFSTYIKTNPDVLKNFIYRANDKSIESLTENELREEIKLLRNFKYKTIQKYKELEQLNAHLRKEYINEPNQGNSNQIKQEFRISKENLKFKS